MDIRVREELPQQQADGDHEDQDGRGHVRERNVALRDVHGVARLAAARGNQGLGDAFGDGASDLDERPHGSNRHGAHADEADLAGEDLVDDVCHRGDVRDIARGAQGQQDNKGDEHAHEHGDTDRQADQVAHADQRHGQGGAQRGGAGTELEVARDRGRNGLHRGEQGQRGGDDAAYEDDAQAFGVFLSCFVRDAVCAVTVADFKDLGRSDALRIGQVRAGNERAAQRDGVHDAEDAADGTHRGRLEEAESRPVADHDEAGQDEDDGGQRTGGGRDGLHDVVFLDVVPLELAEHGHGDDGGGDRRREREAHLESEVHVGGGKHEGDEPADDDAAQRQFRQRCRLFRGPGGGYWCAHARSFLFKIKFNLSNGSLHSPNCHIYSGNHD